MTDTASFPRSVLAYIRRHELLRPGDRVAAAVSGGADSVALLRVMLELRAELGIVLSVAHFNHRIRGEAADADEQFVRDLSEAHGLELHVSFADAPAHAAAQKVSLETAARDLRYGFFRQLISSGAVSKVMTAHTLDDQAETVLMRIMRGTGTSGLAAIYPRVEVCLAPEERTGHSPVPTQSSTTRASGAIIRPLLGARRCEIEDFLRALSQPWREDATNADTKHTRNRVRHVLLPLLETEFSGNVRQRLAELAEIARVEEIDWEQMLYGADTVFAPSPVKEGCGTHVSDFRADNDKHTFDAAKLSRLSLALQRRAIRQLGDELNLRLDFESIDAIQRLTTEETSNVVLPDGWRVIRKITRRPSGGKDSVLLVFEQTEPRKSAAPSFSGKDVAPSQLDYELTFRWPGEIEFPGQSILLRARLIDLGPAQAKPGLERATRANGGGFEWASEPESGSRGHLLDPAKLLPELTLRAWRPGDRFWPAQTSGPKKVKELLQKQHITGPERASWPVLLSGDEIVWLRGFRVSEKHRAALDTEQALLIEEHPGSGAK